MILDQYDSRVSSRRSGTAVHAAVASCSALCGQLTSHPMCTDLIICRLTSCWPAHSRRAIIAHTHPALAHQGLLPHTDHEPGTHSMHALVHQAGRRRKACIYCIIDTVLPLTCCSASLAPRMACHTGLPHQCETVRHATLGYRTSVRLSGMPHWDQTHGGIRHISGSLMVAASQL
jgi:hypothetical protein